MRDQAVKAGARDYHRFTFLFHDRLPELAGNAKLLATYRKLVNELSLFRRQNLTGESMAVYSREHRQIVKAIAAGDAEAAGQAMFQHVMNSRERTLRNHQARQAGATAPPAPAARGGGLDEEGVMALSLDDIAAIWRKARRSTAASRSRSSNMRSNAPCSPSRPARTTSWSRPRCSTTWATCSMTRVNPERRAASTTCTSSTPRPSCMGRFPIGCSMRSAGMSTPNAICAHRGRATRPSSLSDDSSAALPCRAVSFSRPRSAPSSSDPTHRMRCAFGCG